MPYIYLFTCSVVLFNSEKWFKFKYHHPKVKRSCCCKAFSHTFLVQLFKKGLLFMHASAFYDKAVQETAYILTFEVWEHFFFVELHLRTQNCVYGLTEIYLSKKQTKNHIDIFFQQSAPYLGWPLNPFFSRQFPYLGCFYRVASPSPLGYFNDAITPRDVANIGRSVCDRLKLSVTDIDSLSEKHTVFDRNLLSVTEAYCRHRNILYTDTDCQ